MNEFNKTSSATNCKVATDPLGAMLTGLVKALVDHPDYVFCTVVPLETGVMYQIEVAARDLGKVIGRQGRLARSFRTILGAIAANRKESIKLNFVERGDDNTT